MSDAWIVEYQRALARVPADDRIFIMAQMSKRDETSKVEVVEGAGSLRFKTWRDGLPIVLGIPSVSLIQ